MESFEHAVCVFITLALVASGVYRLEKLEPFALQPDYPNLQDLMEQTADININFLGIPTEQIDLNQLQNSLTSKVTQFTFPNNMTWNLDVSTSFHAFPNNLKESLVQNSYYYAGKNYYNITLFDQFYTEVYGQTIPQKGYGLVFTSIPDNSPSHSWFYVNERPDLFLGRTDSFNGYPSQNWMFPPNFGGIHRTMYLDLSDLMQTNPTKTAVTNTVVSLFNNAIPDMFPNLLGKTDPRMLEADIQKYGKYEVKILWLNGTDDEQLPTDKIENAFRDLMPWTNWTLTTQKTPMSTELNALLESRTQELSVPSTYSFTLANGTSCTIGAHRNLEWNVQQDSGENDPLSQYLFAHTEEYFNLTDLADKSIVPVILFETRNGTAISGIAGIGPGISWFPHNTVILGIQAGALEAMQESGPILLTHQIRHEIGHWTSLSHHSSAFGSSYPKIVCSMRSVTDQFCAFCKDARARMSFIGYYNATLQILAANQGKKEFLKEQTNNAVALFENWTYNQALESVIPVYDTAEKDILFAQVTAIPNHILAGKTANVTVHVTDGVNPVPEATILLSSNSSNVFSKNTGTTESDGNFQSRLTTTQSTKAVTIVITANASKSGFVTATKETQLTVAPSETDSRTLLLVLAVSFAAVSICLIVIRRIKIRRK